MTAAYPLPSKNRNTQRRKRQRCKKKFRVWLANENKPRLTVNYELLMRLPPHRRFYG